MIHGGLYQSMILTIAFEFMSILVLSELESIRFVYTLVEIGPLVVLGSVDA